jgi:hypothetical protein
MSISSSSTLGSSFLGSGAFYLLSAGAEEGVAVVVTVEVEAPPEKRSSLTFLEFKALDISLAQ